MKNIDIRRVSMSNTDSNQSKKRSRLQWIIIGILGMAFLCVCGFVAIAVFGPDTNGVVSDESDTAEVASSLTSEDKPTESTKIEELETSTEMSIKTPESTPLPVPTDTPQPVGLSRENPAPIGNEVITEYQIQKVDELIRPADSKIKQANSFNSDPEPGNEYVMVRVTLQCIQPVSEKCNVYLSDYNLSGSTGLIRDSEWLIAGIPHMLESTEMFGGATLSGWLAFEVSQDETGLILAWEPTFSMSTAYMSLSDN